MISCPRFAQFPSNFALKFRMKFNFVFRENDGKFHETMKLIISQNFSQKHDNENLCSHPNQQHKTQP